MTLPITLQTPQTAKRSRRIKLDTSKFNAVSIAIISAAALPFGPVHAETTYAQMTAPAKPAAPTAPAPAGNTAASPDNAKAMEAFTRADKNKDGKLSKEEAESLPAVAQRFESIDLDKDGFISKVEFSDALK